MTERVVAFIGIAQDHAVQRLDDCFSAGRRVQPGESDEKILSGRYGEHAGLRRGYGPETVMYAA